MDKNIFLKAKNILILVHKNADGDAIGSALALAEYLFGINKYFRIFSADGVQDKYDWLKHANKIENSADVFKQYYDLAITIDSADLNYTGIDKKWINNSRILNIDHHKSNEGYGDINILDKSASATAVILYDLFEKIGIKINKEIAESLLVGILTDTDFFRTSSTGRRTLLVAADLIEKGASYNKIIRQVYMDKDENSLKGWGKVFSRLNKNNKLRIAYSIIFKDDASSDKQDKMDGVTNFISNLEEVKVVMILKEAEKGKIKVSLRATDNKTNLLPLVKLFGGGGHEQAAGFLIDGRLEREGNYWQIV